ncbi:MAG: tyrosine-type recombinase/integrase [Rhodospirillales bacterium]|jgi:integrase
MLDDRQFSLNFALGAGASAASAVEMITVVAAPAPEVVPEIEPEAPVAPTLPAPKTLAEVVDRLQADGSLDAIRRRDLLSAVRRIAGAIERPLETLPADQASLRHLIAKATPRLTSLGTKTRSNLVANLKAALTLTGSAPLGRFKGRLSPGWAAFDASLSKSLRIGLSRLLRYLSVKGIDPGDVTGTIFAAFLDRLERTTLGKDPKPAFLAAMRAWNEAVDTVPGWPPVRYVSPRGKRVPVVLPAALAADLDAYLTWAGDTDPFAPNPRAKPLAPSTIRLRRSQIACAVTALTAAGRDPATFTGLADLVEPEALKTIMRHYRTADGRTITTYGRNLGGILMTIERDWVKAGHADLHAEIRRRIGSSDEGLTPKNAELIARLRDPVLRARLLALPRTLVALAERARKGSHKAAVQMQVAVAVEILFKAPMRSANLIALRLDQHILRPQGRHGAIILRLGALETKGHRPQEFEIAGVSRDLVETYLVHHRPVLATADCPFLFPGADHLAQKAQPTLAKQVVEAIARHVGVHMTLHQFRHFAAALLLERDPALLHVVKTLLGHASITTVLRYYARLDTIQAGRMHDEILEGMRAAAPPAKRGRR